MITKLCQTALLITVVLLLAISIDVQAAGNSKNNGASSTGTSGNKNNSNKSGSSNFSESQTQTNAFEPTTHGIDIQVNGSPNIISGYDHDLSGNVKSGQMQAAVNAVGLSQVNGQHVNGTAGDTGLSGILIAGVHNDNNVQEKVQNNLAVKDQDIEKFILAAKNSAHYTIDLSQSGNADAVPTTGGTIISLKGSGNHIGSPGNPKIVYAKGANKDGVYTENNLHLSGNGESHGVLVIEIDDPDKAQFIMSGQYRWVGLVLLVINKRIGSLNKAPFTVTGGGTANHLVGGAMIYYRNHARGPNDKGSIFMKEAYRTNGTSDLRFSYDALQSATVELKESFRVRSWRIIR